jgi:hypothetical protein
MHYADDQIILREISGLGGWLSKASREQQPAISNQLTIIPLATNDG